MGVVASSERLGLGRRGVALLQPGSWPRTGAVYVSHPLGCQLLVHEIGWNALLIEQ